MIRFDAVSKQFAARHGRRSTQLNLNVPTG